MADLELFVHVLVRVPLDVIEAADVIVARNRTLPLVTSDDVAKAKVIARQNKADGVVLANNYIDKVTRARRAELPRSRAALMALLVKLGMEQFKLQNKSDNRKSSPPPSEKNGARRSGKKKKQSDVQSSEVTALQATN